jgi:hypothetical protein
MPANVHVPLNSRCELRTRPTRIHERGRELVALECLQTRVGVQPGDWLAIVELRDSALDG